ncbi:hypothetical protein [Parvularcula lutaonensis]|uniref:HNH endonuclease n=1 Tax=Parvularcula lutaonensis TaxID=491923 RepID=A0ABV7MC52_9PROT|nr:hypothetical protein [Parvularcula lutaonensis]
MTHLLYGAAADNMGGGSRREALCALCARRAEKRRLPFLIDDNDD